MHQVDNIAGILICFQSVTVCPLSSFSCSLIFETHIVHARDRNLHVTCTIGMFVVLKPFQMPIENDIYMYVYIDVLKITVCTFLDFLPRIQHKYLITGY